MGEFLKDVVSLHWWIGVVIVGLLINLISDYVKPRLDQILGSISERYAKRSDSLKKASKERVQRYINETEFRPELRHEEITARLQFVSLLILTMLALGTAEVTTVSIADDTSLRGLIIRSVPYFLTGVVFVFAIGNQSLAMQCAAEIREARKLMRAQTGDTGPQATAAASDAIQRYISRPSRRQRDE